MPEPIIPPRPGARFPKAETALNANLVRASTYVATLEATIAVQQSKLADAISERDSLQAELEGLEAL